MLLLQTSNKLIMLSLQCLDLLLEGQLDWLHHCSIFCYQGRLVLAKAQCWILELLNGLLIKVPIFLPKLQQPGDLLLFFFLYS